MTTELTDWVASNIPFIARTKYVITISSHRCPTYPIFPAQSTTFRDDRYLQSHPHRNPQQTLLHYTTPRELVRTGPHAVYNLKEVQEDIFPSKKRVVTVLVRRGKTTAYYSHSGHVSGGYHWGICMDILAQYGYEAEAVVKAVLWTAKNKSPRRSPRNSYLRTGYGQQGGGWRVNGVALKTRDIPGHWLQLNIR